VFLARGRASWSRRRLQECLSCPCPRLGSRSLYSGLVPAGLTPSLRGRDTLALRETQCTAVDPTDVGSALACHKSSLHVIDTSQLARSALATPQAVTRIRLYTDIMLATSSTVGFSDRATRVIPTSEPCTLTGGSTVRAAMAQLSATAAESQHASDTSLALDRSVVF
jgi:hypothetical protein